MLYRYGCLAILFSGASFVIVFEEIKPKNTTYTHTAAWVFVMTVRYSVCKSLHYRNSRAIELVRANCIYPNLVSEISSMLAPRPLLGIHGKRQIAGLEGCEV